MIRGIFAVRAAALIIAVAPLAAACSGGEDPPGASPTESTRSGDLPASLSAACTAVLNGRHAETFKDASQAGIDVLLAATQKSTPTSSQLDTWRGQLEAGRQQLSDELDALRPLSSEAAWTQVLAPVEDLIERYDARLEATKADWPADVSTLRPAAETEDAPEQALEKLELTGRDCEMLAVEPGPLAGAIEFTRDAASVCSAIVDRRRGSQFAEHSGANLDLVKQVLEGTEIVPTKADQEALEALRTEWQQTAGDFAEIEAADGPDPETWASVEQLAIDRFRVYDQRLTALKSGNAAKIAQAFDRGTIGVPGFDWEFLGLARRDCRSVEA